ncbi:ribonucleoside-diphosphate reductase [Streptomyces uncialis]|uniref:TSCPD domain-containing protein n=1 Tax=Streptomyces uncialis TaxID=1048205 RepID=UPI0036461E86
MAMEAGVTAQQERNQGDARVPRVPSAGAGRRLRSLTRAFTVGPVTGHLIVSHTAGGEPVRVEIRMAKQGSTLRGMLDVLSTTLTRALRLGIPLSGLLPDCLSTRFEPAGMTDDPQIRQATSVPDYVARRLAFDFLPYEQRQELGVLTREERLSGEQAVWPVGRQH